MKIFGVSNFVDSDEPKGRKELNHPLQKIRSFLAAARLMGGTPTARSPRHAFMHDVCVHELTSTISSCFCPSFSTASSSSSDASQDL